jgi:hypothetical protein
MFISSVAASSFLHRDAPAITDWIKLTTAVCRGASLLLLLPSTTGEHGEPNGRRIRGHFNVRLGWTGDTGPEITEITGPCAEN